MLQFALKPAFNPWAEWERELEFFSPATDIFEEEKNYVVSVDVPGFKKEDIEIEIKEKTLFLSGERKGRRAGKFTRTFKLPADMSDQEIKADLHDGVLEITVPKAEKAQSKKVLIA